MIRYKLSLILKQNEAFSKNGLRVLAFAYKELGSEESLIETGENNYIFIGLASMVDPPRKESMAAVADAKAAGIMVQNGKNTQL